MAICSKCGAQLADGAVFCTSCGAPVAGDSGVDLSKPGENVQPAAPAPAPQPQPQQQYQQQAQYNQQYQQPQYQPQPQQYQQYNQYQGPAYDMSDHTAEYDPKDISDNKVFAMSCYLLSVVGIIIALLASNESRFARFHVRQALKITVCEALCAVMCVVPFLGWLAAGVCEIILLIVTIICFFNAAGGKAKEAPILKNFGFLK